MWGFIDKMVLWNGERSDDRDNVVKNKLEFYSWGPYSKNGVTPGKYPLCGFLESIQMHLTFPSPVFTFLLNI